MSTVRCLYSHLHPQSIQPPPAAPGRTVTMDTLVWAGERKHQPSVKGSIEEEVAVSSLSQGKIDQPRPQATPDLNRSFGFQVDLKSKAAI